MAVPKVDGQFIAEAIKYIDENGVPWHNTSTKYELVWENGNTYPPKYVIAVANHLQNGAEIDVSGYNAVEAKNYLTAKGYEIQIKQTKYEITITSDSVTSTDDSFTMDNISAGDVFKPLDASFVAVDGTVIKRNYGKGERRNTNQTLPRIAFQIYLRFSESCSLLLIQDTEVWQERFPPSMQTFMLISMKNFISQTMFISLVR